MGSSSRGGGYGRGGGNLTGCGGMFEFSLIIPDWIDIQPKNLEVGEGIELRLIISTLPRLEVARTLNKLTIGLVPPNYSMLISCIKKGWKYYGSIVKLEGDNIEPRIYIKVKGEK